MKDHSWAHSVLNLAFALPMVVSATIGCSESSSATNVVDAGAGGAPAYGAPPFAIPTEPAAASFLDVFHASRYSQSSSAAQALDQAATADPKDGPLALVRLFAHLWHLSEAARDKSPDGAALQAEAMNGLALATVAKANNPTDPRADCLLGIQQVVAGRATKNDDLLNQGYQTIDIGAKAWPQFALFCVALANDSLPASDPRFDDGVNAIWDSFPSCVGEQIDRNNPDISKYLGQATPVGPNRACWNDPIAPHNAEGTYLYMGDLLVKQGKVATAKIMYHNATLIAEYPQWPYKYLLDDRLNADLDAKAKLYVDGDPTNDPPIGGASDGHYCTFCHAATAEEP